MKTTLLVPSWVDDRERNVAAIVYHPNDKGGWKPFTVFVVSENQFHPGEMWRSEYDFEWCKRDEKFFFNNSGSGPSGWYIGKMSMPNKTPRCCVWFDKDIAGQPHDGAFWSGGDLTDAQIRRFGYDIVSAPLTLDFETGEQNPFVMGSNDKATYCSRCKDWLPDEDLCEHCFYCDVCETWSTPSKRCKHRRPRA